MVTPEEDEASKTEEPSERKISKAKEEGDVAISQDAKSFLMLLGMLFVIWMLLPLMMKWFYTSSIVFLEKASSIEITPQNFQKLLIKATLDLFKIMGFPFLIFITLGVIASISQTGFIYAPKKLEPNWDKLNIFSAMANFINMKKIVDALKGIIKITVVSFIALLVVKPYLEKVGVSCPICGKDVVYRKTKKGRRYYGCENNPECEFMSWQKPIDKKCPKCGKYMVEKGNNHCCSDEKCGFVGKVV